MLNALPSNIYQGGEDFDYGTVEEHGVCDCIPDCENFEYSIDTSLSTFSRKNSLNEIEFLYVLQHITCMFEVNIIVF